MAIKIISSRHPASLPGLLLLLVVLCSQSASTQTANVLYSFRKGIDGVYPSAGVVRDPNGNLYGTTTYGGANGLGTVFKVTDRRKTILHNFAGEDGANPGTLIRDTVGNLYGISASGGDFTCPIHGGCGVVFKLDAVGNETVLHRFTEKSGDGAIPTALAFDSKGDLYGTTELGGPSNNGTIFKLDSKGRETVLYSFPGGSAAPNGANPNSLALDPAGNVFGTTSYGGACSWGTVFKLDSSGVETVLHSFAYGADGGTPGGLVIDPAGNLLGVTTIGGVGNSGTLFKVDQTGGETVLYSFNTKPGDGGTPSSLVLDPSGNIYGNTLFGGANELGTIFKFDAAGNESVVVSFGGALGNYPQGTLSLATTVTGVVVYGTTQQGGTFGWGTVFQIVP